MNRLHCQVDDRHGTAGFVIDLDAITPEQKARAAEIIDRHVAAAAEATGLHPVRIQEFFLSEAIRRLADYQAYEREARRRGVLAL